MKTLKKKYELAENEAEKQHNERRKTELKMAKINSELEMTNTILHTTSKTKKALFNEKIELKTLLTETVKEMETKVSRLEKDLEYYKLTSTEKDKTITSMHNDQEKFESILTENNKVEGLAYDYKHELDQTNTLLSSMTNEVKMLKSEKKTLRAHAESIINKNHELIQKHKQFQGLSDDLNIALCELETTKSLLNQKDSQLQIHLNLEEKTKKSINDLKIDFADTVAMLDNSRSCDPKQEMSEKIANKMIDLSGALARETETNAMLRKEIGIIQETADMKLTALNSSLKQLEQNRNTLVTKEEAFKDQLEALDSVIKNIVTNKEGAIGEKIVSLTHDLKRSQSTIEKFRYSLTKKRRSAAVVSVRHKSELASMAKDLQNMRLELGKTKEKLAINDGDNKQKLEQMSSKYSDVMRDLENAIVGMQTKDQKINKLTQSYESMKEKTQQLLSSLGFEGEKGRQGGSS